MTLYTYQLSRDRPGDFELLRALARIHLAAWLVIPLMQTIMYRPAAMRARTLARYRKSDWHALASEDAMRLVVVLDDELEPDVEDYEENEDGGSGGDETQRPPKGRVVAALKYYLVPATGPHPDTDTQAEIESREGTGGVEKGGKGGEGDGLAPPSESLSNDALSDLYVAALIAARQDARRVLGDHVLVDVLYTDPAHHRRGAAGMLMRVAVQEADEIGWPCMLEASPLGMKVYEQAGFKVLAGHEIWLDLRRWEDGGDKGEEFSERRLAEAGGVRRAEDGWYGQFVMTRPARATV